MTVFSSGLRSSVELKNFRTLNTPLLLNRKRCFGISGIKGHSAVGSSIDPRRSFTKKRERENSLLDGLIADSSFYLATHPQLLQPSSDR